MMFVLGGKSSVVLANLELGPPGPAYGDRSGMGNIDRSKPHITHVHWPIKAFSASALFSRKLSWLRLVAHKPGKKAGMQFGHMKSNA